MTFDSCSYFLSGDMFFGLLKIPCDWSNIIDWIHVLCVRLDLWSVLTWPVSFSRVSNSPLSVVFFSLTVCYVKIMPFFVLYFSVKIAHTRTQLHQTNVKIISWKNIIWYRNADNRVTTIKNPRQFAIWKHLKRKSFDNKISNYFKTEGDGSRFQCE